MRIVLVAARYLPNQGGLETVVHEISQQMEQAGHTVIIITNRYPTRLAKVDRIDGIPVTRLRFLLPRLAYLKSRRLDLWLAGWVFFPLSLIELYVILRRFHPDLVNVQYLGIPAFFIWLAQGLLSFHLVVSLHGGDVDSEPYKNRFNGWLFNAVTRRADQVTACSKILLDQALTLAPDLKTKAQVVHNGVNVAQFMSATPYNHPRRYLLGIGQLVKHKGFDLLVAAFSQIADVWPEVDLLLAGDGPEHDALNRQIQAAQLDGRVHLLGSVDHHQVAALMRGSLAVIIPSRREPFGIVGLEAMASGRPIIASRIDGLVEALEGADVNWFASDDLPGLTQTLNDVLKNGSSHGAMKPIADNSANQARVQAQSWQKVAEHYLAAFQMHPARNNVSQP
ncbi:MAG: glycosyltransferase family 4 protein [Aggregatilineales bacterium]